MDLNSFALFPYPTIKSFYTNIFTLVANRSKGQGTTMLNSQKFLFVSLQHVFRLLKSEMFIIYLIRGRLTIPFRTFSFFFFFLKLQHKRAHLHKLLLPSLKDTLILELSTQLNHVCLEFNLICPIALGCKEEVLYKKSYVQDAMF